ncbi:MAG TPA: prolyl oligopeptidase family serine peptidase, partial [Candidatus Eremiobacteraceae bacterium]|nr:prolyl oligopeptidase family serine peptidase [Candidatus Eremiobacteraceae bacterium]
MRPRIIGALALVGLLCLFTGANAGTSDTAAQRTVAHTPVDLGPGAPTPGADPFLWLEDVHGARALAWVKSEDDRTTAALQSDPHYAALYADAVKTFETKDRIPYPQIIGGQVYNFWRDETHVRGILRRTSLQSYSTANPSWTTVLDLDKVAKAENANWVYEGLNCPFPEERRCLVALSDGGEDAQTVREFDLTTGSFVSGGFELPRAKQDEVWENNDTLLVDRPWTPDEVTTSGYAYIVKQLHRGQALAQATEVFRGKPSDVGVNAFTLDDGAGHHVAMIARNVDFFNSEYYLVDATGAHQLAVPKQINFQGLIDGRIVLTLNEQWATNGKTYPAGALVALDLDAVKADPAHLKPTLIYTPGSRESLGDIASTKDRLLVVSYLNVQGRALDFTPGPDDTWTQAKLDLPTDSTISIADTNLRDDTAFVSVTSFLTPTTLYKVDAASGASTTSKTLPPQFDGSNDVVEQHEATSKDGTQIPYFIVHPKNMQPDGTNPTVINAYGGFQISETPFYSSTIGKLWLERGGTFVLANIRGGGEFGPAWHDAGLKTHRQVIYDDFYAVARDLVARKITSPRRLGITGASNGGLLMGVEFTQHPETYNAVDIGVPLL